MAKAIQKPRGIQASDPNEALRKLNAAGSAPEGGAPVADVPGQYAIVGGDGKPIAELNTGAAGASTDAEAKARKKRDLGKIVIQVEAKRQGAKEGEQVIVFRDAEKLDLALGDGENLPECESADDAVSFIRAKGLAGRFRVIQVKRTFSTKPRMDCEIVEE